MLFGDKISQLRKTKGLSQQELSRLSGVSQTYISKLEDNQRQPTIGKVISLSKALGVTVADLLEQQ